MDPRILARKQLWRHEELKVGSFERGTGYNEFARHIGFHHVLSLMLHAPDGRLGNYPIWRSRDMRPFSREDREFAAAILPHLNHALAIAAAPAAEIIDGEAGFSPVAKYDLGLVMIDTDGRILAANRPAQSIFYTLQVFDESSQKCFGIHCGQQFAQVHRRNLAQDFSDFWRTRTRHARTCDAPYGPSERLSTPDARLRCQRRG